jgi:hypothetical protein
MLHGGYPAGDQGLTGLRTVARIGDAVVMPADDPTPRRRARWSRLLAAGAVVLVVAGGCSDQTGQGIARGDLVTDLATQLERSAALTYSAVYQLSGGATATMVQAQQPPRSAYLYPGGMVATTADAATECHRNGKILTCTMTTPPSSTGRPPATLLDGAGRHAMVTPAVVLTLLNAAALDTDAEINQHDTTIAGRHATCVEVRNVDDAAASSFTACITTEGVLGSFTGTVAGAPVDVAMTHYAETVDGGVFDPPATAKIIDRRPGAAAVR